MSSAPPPKDSGPARYLIADLCKELERYLTTEQVREVYEAYLFGAEAHINQKRATGEPYIYHPIAVARILAQMRMDHQCLIAAMLHDVIEDTGTAKEQLAAKFGDEVAELVDGVTKLTKINSRSRVEEQAENFRKMVMAMTKDVRVILIKLADRLHNMRTLGVMRPDKQRRIASETLDIFAPIANRLGINHLRLELENLSFAAYYPMRYRILRRQVDRLRGKRIDVIAKIETNLRQRLHQEGIDAEVMGREKHIYSIYRKMKDKKHTFHDVVDVFAFRVLVDRLDTCYRALGAAHNLYKPIPGRFRDYIAIPKNNGYQSLHTVLVGPNGFPIEIQIRTREMHQLAESGIAAHWLYKSSGANGENGAGLTQTKASDWLKHLLELQHGAGNPIEFLEHVKVDLFPDEVYIFTPSGQIMVLPRGGTALDFAYAVHTQIGNRCVAARVDRRLVPLRTELHTGQSVEIITTPEAKPNPAWLNFVVTSRARAAIRTYLRQIQRTEAVELGRSLIEKALSAHNASLEQVSSETMAQVVREFKKESLEELLVDVGLGNLMPFLVSRLLLGETAEPPLAPPAGSAPLPIRGTEGMVVSYAKCCRPIPGDAITGLFTPGKGIVIHRQECGNLSEARRAGTAMDVTWEDHSDGEFLTEFSVDVGNKRGVLATIASTIAELGSNIENVNAEERDGLTTTLRFVATAQDRRHLANIMRRLRSLPEVLRIQRGPLKKPKSKPPGDPP